MNEIYTTEHTSNKENTLNELKLKNKHEHLKEKLKTHNERIDSAEEEIIIKIRKLMKLNQQNTKKTNDNLIKIIANPTLLITAYGNIQTNKGALSEGTDPSDTVDGFNELLVENIGNNLRNGCYKWKSSKLIEIPKPGKTKKRPLGIQNFSDKLVQECIRIVLTAIYEPTFQEYDCNHGFRPNRSTHTVLRKIAVHVQGMEYALEGDIVGAYPAVNHNILIKLLKKKISDKKFLKLIENGLKQDIIFGNKIIHNKKGTPQGAIASPILFNIYMHEFDKKVIKIINRKNHENVLENRKKNIPTKKYASITVRLHKLKKRMNKLSKEKIFNKTLFRQCMTEYRLKKKIQFSMSSTDKARSLKRLQYFRYADDWVLFSNEKIETAIDIKNELSTWLKNYLELELDSDKTKITDLNREKVKFLGFTFFNHIQKRTTFKKKKGVHKGKTNKRIFIGIDHVRVKDRFKSLNIINDKHLTRYVGLYCSLKPWQIVQKFRQKFEGIGNYYYPHLTYPSDLAIYYYFLRYSCIKTLAHRMNKSVSQIQKIYGNKLKMKGERITKDSSNRRLIKEFVTTFPTYMEAMDKLNALNIFMKPPLENEAKDILKNPENKIPDPLSHLDIKSNTRTGSKIYMYCSICGTDHARNNPIEMHHIKHVRKGKVQGFSRVLKELGRKRIPCCQKCHRKIHKGEYNGLSLSDLYDIELITL